MEAKNAVKVVEEGLVPARCSKREDFYSKQARGTIARLLGDWLGHQHATASELIHSAVLLRKLEETGTVYQHALQKMAVATAAQSKYSVVTIIKQLNNLIAPAMNSVCRDERNGLFPVLEGNQLVSLVETLVDAPDRRYVLSGAITKHLRSAKSWDAKLRCLSSLRDEIPKEGSSREFLSDVISPFMIDLLTSEGAVREILGPNLSLGEILSKLVHIFLGDAAEVPEGGGESLNELARHFARDEFPDARAAIANLILNGLKSPQKLCPDSVRDEWEMLSRIVNDLVRRQDTYLNSDELTEAVALRSKRLATQEKLLQLISDAKTSEEKLERLLFVEENIIGIATKRPLAAFIMAITASHGFEELMAPDLPCLERLRCVAKLQNYVLHSGFQDVQKNQISAALDAIAMQIETRANVLIRLEKGLVDPVERAQALLPLCASGVFTQGKLAEKAQAMLLASLATTGFLAGYMKDKKVSRQDAVSDLTTQLTRAGIAPAIGLRSLAA